MKLWVTTGLTELGNIMAINPPASKLGGLMCQQRTQILDVIEGHIEFLSHPTHTTS
jgi:hypothetical protein